MTFRNSVISIIAVMISDIDLPLLDQSINSFASHLLDSPQTGLSSLAPPLSPDHKDDDQDDYGHGQFDGHDDDDDDDEDAHQLLLLDLCPASSLLR